MEGNAKAIDSISSEDAAMVHPRFMWEVYLGLEEAMRKVKHFSALRDRQVNILEQHGMDNWTPDLPA